MLIPFSYLFCWICLGICVCYLRQASGNVDLVKFVILKLNNNDKTYLYFPFLLAYFTVSYKMKLKF